MQIPRKWLLTPVVAIGSMVLGSVGLALFKNVPAAQAQPPAPAPAAAEGRSAITDISAAFKQVSRKVAPSVVSINSMQMLNAPNTPEVPDDLLRRFFHEFGNPDQGDNATPKMPPATPRRYERIGTGSGVIMETSGGVAYILTNNHVVDGATDLKVHFADGRSVDKAQVVGRDANTDLAVVKVKIDNVTPATWGDSNELQPGDWVLAFGSPFGYVGSMTHGIVSALHRQVGILGPYGYENFIQVDAPINPGNSGGPLVNLRGEVVGINTAIASRSGGFQGIGFATPSSTAKNIYMTLREKGQVVRGWLGVEIGNVADMTAEAKASGYTGNNGVLVKGVLRGSPATGKLEPGDVLTGINGKEIQNSTELRNQVASAAPGSPVTLQVVRSGKKEDVKVEVGQQPTQPVLARTGGTEQPETAQALGMRLTDLNTSLAQRYGVDAKAGAVVTSVSPGSLASEAGIRAGDVITKVGDQQINSASDAQSALKKADVAKGVRILIANRQGTEVIFLQRQNEPSDK